MTDTKNYKKYLKLQGLENRFSKLEDNMLKTALFKKIVKLRGELNGL